MVNRVELDLVNHVLGVGGFDHGPPLFRQDGLDTSNKAVGVGHVRQHVVGQEQISLLPLVSEPLGEGRAEKLVDGVDAFFDGHLGDVPRGLDAQNGNAALNEVLEHIPVVAGRLDDQALCP